MISWFRRLTIRILAAAIVTIASIRIRINGWLWLYQVNRARRKVGWKPLRKLQDCLLAQLRGESVIPGDDQR